MTINKRAQTNTGIHQTILLFANLLFYMSNNQDVSRALTKRHLTCLLHHGQHHLINTGVAIHIQENFSQVFLMVNPTHPGRTLLQSPVAFVPQLSTTFPWTVPLVSATSGFAGAIVIVFAWIFSLD